MKCRHAQELMGAYLYGDLAPDQMRDLRVHTQDCALCREDLAARGRIVSSLGDATPELSDTDRQRIAWSVKGAIGKRQVETRPLALRLAPLFALAAAVLVAGFVLGRVTPHSPKQLADSREHSRSPDVRVEVREKPSSTDETSQAVDKAINLLESVSAITATTSPNRETGPGRLNNPHRRNLTPPPDNLIRMTPDSGSAVPRLPDGASGNSNGSPKDSSTAPKKTETGTDSGQTKLPRVTDPKNAETTPSESQ